MRGIPFALVASDIVIPERCPVLDIPLMFGAAKNHPNAPSIDRKIPTEGYVPDNIAVISRRANSLKSDCTNAAELYAVARYMENNNHAG